MPLQRLNGEKEENEIPDMEEDREGGCNKTAGRYGSCVLYTVLEARTRRLKVRETTCLQHLLQVIEAQRPRE